MARTGVDADFGRGAREIERTQFAGPVAEEADKTNPVMWPISNSGPYYATLIVPGVLDTKGGPKTNASAQVLDDMEQPIPGLYGVGNCVAGVTARAYWSGGATLGPMLGFALRAAEAAHREPPRLEARR
jgi:predicted oxidoreductase